MAKVDITFCIFSFNRGEFLRNCVASIEKAAPGAEIVVFDDCSDDPNTVAYLEELVKRHRVIFPQEKNVNKHGGLYGNMQSALELLSDRNLICTLQDDTQLIRPIFPAEVGDIVSAFRSNPTLGFIHPFFIKSSDRKSCEVSDDLPTYSDFLIYRRDCGQSAGIHYSDLVIYQPSRLLERNWRFQSSEPTNDRQAREMFGKMAYLAHPFAMWLPSVPTYRGKRKTWALARAEKKLRCGFYPFVIWSNEQSRQFVMSKRNSFAIAEDFLDCGPGAPEKPWTYTPLTGLRFLKILNSLEVRIRGWFSSRG